MITTYQLNLMSDTPDLVVDPQVHDQVILDNLLARIEVQFGIQVSEHVSCEIANANNNGLEHILIEAIELMNAFANGNSELTDDEMIKLWEILLIDTNTITSLILGLTKEIIGFQSVAFYMACIDRGISIFATSTETYPVEEEDDDPSTSQPGGGSYHYIGMGGRRLP